MTTTTEATTADAATTPPFHTVLIANRGEIAVRVIRTCRRLGIRTVAVYSDADAGALHVAEADLAVRLGPAPARESYLDIERVLDAARRTGAQAVHPGYGFLSENTDFARACEKAGIVFLGPPAEAIRVMGDKITAKATVAGHGVPLVPGLSRPGLTDEELIAGAAEVGYPVLVKPSAGGGGKGMREVERPEDLPAALLSARRESASAFGDDALFLERLVRNPRHIEVQVLADAHGNVVYLGERECSLQRRHQKVIEEAPSALLDAATRERIGTAACDTARSVGYTGAGTVEFIVSADAPDEFFFMEMNTRLQVEHPVTEAVTGLDLVEWQLRVGAGEELDFAQDDVALTGHAVEARIYAEDPDRGFLPTGGGALGVRWPRGEGIRVDTGIRGGQYVGVDYDPMLAKVIAHGADRAQALRRLDEALGATAIPGVVNNIGFLRFLLADADVVAGRLDTGLIERRLPDYASARADDRSLLAAALDRLSSASPGPDGGPWSRPSGWRLGRNAPLVYAFDLPADERPATDAPGASGDGVVVRLWPVPGNAGRVRASVDGGPERELGYRVEPGTDGARRLELELDDLRSGHDFWSEAPPGAALAASAVQWMHSDGVTLAFRIRREDRRARDGAAGGTEVRSPMPGTVIAVPAADGAVVGKGEPLVVVEAMKMEHVLAAPADGVASVRVRVGQQVALDELLASVDAPADAQPDPQPAGSHAATTTPPGETR